MGANALERAVLANTRGYAHVGTRGGRSRGSGQEQTAAEREVRNLNRALARVALRWPHEYEGIGPLPGDAKPCQITSLLALISAHHASLRKGTLSM